ncbi:MAG: S8 family serine peptidase [Armatimonadetes bacterium]|nr:S8 family serine peptidase [Armatimonadota bacterium]
MRSWASIDISGAIDAYYLRIADQNVTDAATVAAVDALKANPMVRYAGTNRIAYYDQSGGTVTPNDPRYGEQWDKIPVKMPQAWTVEKGKASVVAVIVDSGVQTSHPEFPASRTYKGYNSATLVDDGNPITAAADHGTHVAGIAAAQGNNSLGICGIAWDNVWILPICAGDAAGSTTAALIESSAYIAKHMAANPDKKYVVNMSLGATVATDTPDATEPFTLSMLKNAAAGVVYCVSAGNDGDGANPPKWPAVNAQLSPNVLCVAASNHLGKWAYYSEYRPYTTIAAPGGDDQAGKLILSTITGSAYGEKMGTSMAAPQVTGAVALLLSLPGVVGSEIKGYLTSTASPVAGYPIPSPQVGYGIIDVNAALLKAGVGVTITEPEGTGGKAASSSTGRQPDPVETLRPVIRVSVNQIRPANLVIKVNGATVSDWTVENIQGTITDENSVVVPVRYEAVISTMDLAPGDNRVDVQGTKVGPPDLVVTDFRNFVVKPHQITQGRTLISIPYYQDAVTPESYFGADFRLARWLPGESKYAVYTAYGTKEAGASFNPTDTVPHIDGSAVGMFPVGLAYWADVESIKPVLTHGVALTSKSFVIPLKGTGASSTSISWNMVGCPFPYSVPWNALLLDTPEGRMPVGTAVTKGYILANLYTYDGTEGYSFRTLPDGALVAWQGHWIGVRSKQDVALVVPPVRISTSKPSNVTTAPVGRDGWALRIVGSQGSVRDGANYIGQCAAANDAVDGLDAPKPPMPDRSVTVSLTDGSSVVPMARDLRSLTGAQSWRVSVASDLGPGNVTLSWTPQGVFPRNRRVTLLDEATGVATDMRTRTSVVFSNSTDGSPRTYKITAAPATANVARVSNLSVRQTAGRAAGAVSIGFSLAGDATYEVRVLGSDGRSVAAVATRAASIGDQRVVWPGKDSAGRSVPAGAYLVQVRATTADGESVRVVQPFMMVR